MKFPILTFFALIGFSGCYGQEYRSELRGKKIYIYNGSGVVDSIALFTPHYSENLIHGNVIYFTDGHFVPDQLTIKVFRKVIANTDRVTSAEVDTLSYEWERFIRIKLSREWIVLRYRNETGRKRIKLKISSILEDS